VAATLLGETHMVLREILERIVAKVREPRVALILQAGRQPYFVLVALPTDA
jgi:hypothetical protein